MYAIIGILNKMTDKIITTFETPIIWYYCSDILPEESLILFKLKNNSEILSGEFELHSNGIGIFRLDGLPSYPVNEVDMWANVPRFE